MNELQALVSPTTLPCNGSATTNVQTWSLQLTIVNTSTGTVDLSSSGLRIEFVVDPGGIGSAGALILSQYSTGEPAGGTPEPAVVVEAAPATGTTWTITATQDAPCAFLAIPEAGAGQIGVNGSVAFVFANIATDLIPGASPVTVTVLPGTTVTVAETPAIVKTAAALSITHFTFSSLLLAAPDNTTDITWATVGAAGCELSWTDQNATGDQSTTVVTFNGQPVSNPWTAAPVQVTQGLSAALFYPTQFTLIAEGAAQLTAQVPVGMDPAGFASNATTVGPYDPFILTWTAYDGSVPSLTWQSNGLVTMTDNATNQTIDQGVALSGVTGSATVQITGATTFSLQLADGNPPVPVQVSVQAVSLSGLSASTPQVVDSATGQQQVTLSWAAQNASGFVLTGTDGTSMQLPYTATTVEVYLPRNTGVPEPVAYTLQAQGFSPSGTLPSESLTVAPLEVTLANLTASATQVIRGHAVTLYWSASCATSLTVYLNSPSTPIASYLRGDTQSYPLPTPTYTAYYGVIAHGYTAGGPEPTLAIEIDVEKPPKEKEKEKEAPIKELVALEKQAIEQPQVAGSGARDVHGGGTERPFIGPDERVDVRPPSPRDPAGGGASG